MTFINNITSPAIVTNYAITCPYNTGTYTTTIPAN